MDVYLNRLPRVVQHVKLMLEDRGYDASYYARFRGLDDIIGAALARGISIGETLSTIVKPGIQVSFVDPLFDLQKNRDIMTSSYQIHGCVGEMPAIVICYSKLSPDANKQASRLKKRVQVIPFSALAFPLSRHVMVPRHTALSEAQATEFEETRGIRRENLPVLKSNDAVRIWYGWPRNTIVKIDRPSGTVWRVVK